MAQTQQAKPTTNVVDIIDSNEVIIFRAFRKTQMPVKVNPLRDSTGKHYTGQGSTGYYEDLNEEDKRKLGYVITPTTYISISEGKVLRVGAGGKDLADWKWIQKHPYIVLTKEAGYSSRDASYYVYNQVDEAQTKLKRTDAIDKAVYLMRQASQERRNLIAEAFGFPEARTAPNAIVTDWLREKCNDIRNGEANSIKVIAMLSDDDESKVLQRAMGLFSGLMHYKIIGKMRAGIFRWNGEDGLVLGSTEEEVVAWLSRPVNIETISVLENELTKARNINAK